MSVFARSAIKKIAFQFRKITPDRYKDVMYHLQDSDHQQDPFNKEFSRCLKTGGCEYAEHLAYKTLRDNLSFVIYNEDKKIAGVILNGIYRPQDLKEFDVCLKKIKESNFRELLLRKYEENKNYNIFKTFNVKEIFELQLMSVLRSYDATILCKHLIYMSEVLAKNQGFKLIKADTFSEFPLKHLKRCGFQNLNDNNDLNKYKISNNQVSLLKFNILYKKL